MGTSHNRSDSEIPPSRQTIDRYCSCNKLLHSQAVGRPTDMIRPMIQGLNAIEQHLDLANRCVVDTTVKAVQDTSCQRQKHSSHTLSIERAAFPFCGLTHTITRNATLSSRILHRSHMRRRLQTLNPALTSVSVMSTATSSIVANSPSSLHDGSSSTSCLKVIHD